MLQIKLDTDFLYIAAGTETELERQSTVFLQNEALYEQSIPITIPYSDLNSRLLGHRFFEITDKSKGSYDVEVWDNGTYRYNATLIIQSSNVQSEFPGKSNATGYLNIGLSRFYKLIKDKKLNSLDLGGDNVIAYTTSDPTDLSGGYWQHLHDTWNYTENYVAAPIKMDTWTAYEEDDGWMNKMAGSSLMDITTIIGLQIKISYLMDKIFMLHGWSLDVSQLDSNYDRLLYFSAKPIKINNQGTPHSSITINIANHISPEVTCSNFFLSLCRRFGWAPIFDTGRNVCTLIPVNDISNGSIKDFTQYAGGDIADDYSNDDKIFAWKNNIPSDDGYPSEASTSSYTIGTAVFAVDQLPDPSSGNYDEQIRYVFQTNQWYKVEFNSTTSLREWIYYADGIYGLEPDNANETFETDASTLAMSWSENGTYGALVPIAKIPMDKPYGIRTLLWHGLVSTVDNTGAATGVLYPYVSALAVLPDGNIALPWSNVYEHESTGIDYGIVNQLWSNFTAAITSAREIQRDIYLPLHELINLDWNDVINIRNIPHLIKSFVEPLPYKGFIRATMQKCEIHGVTVVSNGGGAPPGTTIYLHIEWFSTSHFATFGDYENGMKGSVRVKAYSDAAGTVPFTPTGLTVQYRIQRYDDGVAQIPSYQSFTMNAQSVTLYTDVVKEGVFTPSSPEFHEYVYALVAYLGYTII
jgi:hypothetical protein